MAAGEFVLWMLPFLGFALIALYVGYVAHETRLERERAANAPPPGPDPAIELAQVNAQMRVALEAARETLEAARDTVRRGTRG